MCINGTRLKVVAIVDPWSTGCCLAQEAIKRGYGVIAVWSRSCTNDMKADIPSSCMDLTYVAEVNEGQSVDATSAALREASKSCDLVAVMCGGESGVSLADSLSENTNLRSNGTNIPQRRDKKVQQDLIKSSGLRSIRQAVGNTYSDVETFLKSQTWPVVVKPVVSAGSDGVKLCHNMEEAKEYFHLLMESQRKASGSRDAAVLCQEFLQGKEYVVDHVSRDGVHKTAMVWAYDKRSANGAAYVYFGLVPVDSDSPEARAVIPYMRRVLDAMGVKNGASHGEVIMTNDGPCLVEMNCRARGSDGNWQSLARALCGGYSQVDATVDAYLDGPRFTSLPDKPPSPFKAAGQEVMLVSFSRGKVQSTPGYDVIKHLPSFACLETSIDKGSQVDYTTDLFSNIGSVILVHKDKDVVDKDLSFIRYLEEINGFFQFETKMENLKRPRGDAIALSPIAERKAMGKAHDHRRVFSSDGPHLVRHFSNDRPELGRTLMKRMTTVDASMEAVIIVDPYSTGCCVAREIQKRGYKLICLWSNECGEAMKDHVPSSCAGLTYFAEVEEQKTVDDTIVAIKMAAKSFRIVACICGGESGVSYTDKVSEKLGVRTNGTHIPHRRDKKVQQELVKAEGMRSVRQAGGKTFSDVEHFLRTEQYPVVVKPVESAGSDGVKLCHNFDEAKEHFDVLMSSQQLVGSQDAAVLCQEFLRGKEYVVDQVSRDGVHKTVMCWVYDKRAVNGAAFVYFGLVPLDSESHEAKLIIPYARKVLDALGFANGASHGEFIMTPDGPCLVEMNCRAHGGDGNWSFLTRELCGYTQVDASVDAYLDKKQFSILPEKMVSPFKASGQEVMLVSFSKGTVTGTPGFDEIRKMHSFVYLETGIKVGSEVDYTVDLFTSVGSVILTHPDSAVMKRDLDRIRQMEKENSLFEYKTKLENLKAPGSMRDVNKKGHRRVISIDRQEIW